MSEQTYFIKFDDVSAADANIYAEELRDTLLDAAPNVKVDRRREDLFTQDFGATLVLVLGTPAVIAIAKALGNWLQIRNSAKITIKTPEGSVIATNLSSKDASRLSELFLNKK